jgi:hypothetical protein
MEDVVFIYIYNFCPQFLCLHFYVLAKVYHGVVAKQQELWTVMYFSNWGPNN